MLLDQLRTLVESTRAPLRSPLAEESSPGEVAPSHATPDADARAAVAEVDTAITDYFANLLAVLSEEFDETDDTLWGFIAEAADAAEAEGILPELPEGTPTPSDHEVLVKYLAALKATDFSGQVLAHARGE